MSKIEIKNLTVDYTEKKNRFTALRNVSFSIEEGEFVSIIGSSGCGKSTLLSILEGINFPTSGEILIDGEPIKGTGTDRGVTMLFSVILPASLPQIFIGCNQGLTVSFVLLTSAEMIGAQSGLGFYIKNYSDFGDYTRTLVGLIVIGIVIVVISFGFNKIQKYLLRWKH